MQPLYRQISFFAFLSASILLSSACGSGGGTPNAPPPPNSPAQTSIQIHPAAPTLHLHESLQFTATVTGSADNGVTWSLSEEAGSITPEGLYTAPDVAGTYQVVATSRADPSRRQTAAVTVIDLPPPATVSIRLNPETAQLEVTQHLHLTAAVSGAADAAVIWTIEEGDGGAVLPEEGGALYTPAKVGTFHIVASSPADPSARAVATVTVNPSPPPPVGSVQVRIAPEKFTLRTGEQIRLAADVFGAADTAVAWTVQEGPLGGSIGPEGVYTAPGRSGIYHINAASRADGSKSAQAIVTVVAPVMVTLSPSAAALGFGQQQTFQAAVTGSDNQEVDWAIQEGSAGGSIDAAADRATYTAPGTEGIFHLVATSRADRNRSAIAAVTVTPRAVISVEIQPKETSLSFGERQSFTATVRGDANQSVAWSIQGGGGAISPEGVYTAPNAEGVFQVVAQSTADPSRRAAATVTVRPPQARRTVERISVSSAGTPGNDFSRRPFLGGDGRFVAFESSASNLVAGDGNHFLDVFVRDRQAGTTRRVSVSSAGAEGDGISFGAKMSGDGRFIVFESQASTLVAGDTNGFADIFVHDLQTGVTERASVGNGNVEARSASAYAYTSWDGRFVVFYSSADNLVAGDTNGVADIFVRDRQAGTTERVSVSSDGVQGDAVSFCPSISEDGRFVSFVSYAKNLVPGDTNGAPDIFVHDPQTGETRRVSVSTQGVGGNDASSDAKISGNGRFVAFFSEASNLVPGDTNRVGDLFVHDLQTGTTTRVSTRTGGAEGDRVSYDARISRDGRYVTFDSDATNLVEGDNNNATDIYVHDRQTGITSRASADRNGVGGNGASQANRISGDGRFVAFDSSATNLVPGDSNERIDVFIASVP